MYKEIELYGGSENHLLLDRKLCGLAYVGKVKNRSVQMSFDTE